MQSLLLDYTMSLRSIEEIDERQQRGGMRVHVCGCGNFFGVKGWGGGRVHQIKAIELCALV